jgi:outer membrane protein assembly factor BamB
MRVFMICGLLLPLFPPPAISADWTTSYAGLSRASYLAGESVTPPFALQWEYESPQPLKGAPLVALSRAYVSDSQLHVWSLNISDGTVAWKHDEARNPSEVRCYDALTGDLKWVQTVDGNLIHTPQVAQTVVYVSSSSGLLYAFNQMDGKPLWKTALGYPLTLPAADAGLVLVGSGNILCGISPIGGEQIFKVDMASPVTGVPVVAPEGGYVTISDAVMAVDRDGKERWRAKLKSPAWASLAVTKDGVLVGCVDGSVKLLARETGAVKWEELLAGTPNVVAGAGDAVYAGTRQGTLVGMNLADGAKLWSAALGRGPVDGMALSDGRLVVVAGKWVGALLPAPEAPENLSVRMSGKQAELAWVAAKVNGSPISAYRVFRRRGANDSQVAVVPANILTFGQDVLPGGIGYSLVAIGENGAESTRSAEVTLAKGEPLVKHLAVTPVPYDPRAGALAVNFELRDGARVMWTMLDAEGRQVTEESTVVMPRGLNLINWNGVDRMGKPVEPGVYRVQLRAAAEGEESQVAKAFPVAYGFDSGTGELAGAAVPAGAGTASGATGSPSAGSASGTGNGASGGTSGGAVSDGSGGSSHDNGVRDHGQGSGRDGAGQGKGQGETQRSK